MNLTERLVEIAQAVAREHAGLFRPQGPGRDAGNGETARFMHDLRARAKEAFGVDYSEKGISLRSSERADFYIEPEATMVEVALGLPNPNSEFEKDLLKAAIAKTCGMNVRCLQFISKPGGERKLKQPGAQEKIDWMRDHHHIEVAVCDLQPPSPLAGESGLLSEAALAQDWARPEEDAAWSHLQSAP